MFKTIFFKVEGQFVIFCFLAIKTYSTESIDVSLKRGRNSTRPYCVLFASPLSVTGAPVVACAPLVVSQQIVLYNYDNAILSQGLTVSQVNPFEDTIITTTNFPDVAVSFHLMHTVNSVDCLSQYGYTVLLLNTS